MIHYVDIPATMQVIGGVYLNNNLFEDERYHFSEEDFSEEFHKILFGSIYNLYLLGAREIDCTAIEHYLEQRPKAFAVYKNNKGAEYLQKLADITQLSTFDYYYNRVKKMTLLRMYQSIGMDLSWLYNPDEILNIKKKQAQEDWFDNTSIEEIANIIDDKIANIRLKYVNDEEDASLQAGTGIDEFIESLKNSPEYGYSMFGPYMNTVTRGARLKKVYLRSAATGIGKTRAMIADACTFSCREIYDIDAKEWVVNECCTPTLFIATEQDIGEIQSMLLAFVADVDEEHILTGQYLEGEWERVKKAADVIKKAPLYIKELPDFSMQDIENVIKRHILDFGVKCVVFDYLHSSMKILSEISSKAGVKGLREDNVLFMISVRLKDLANQYGVFILTATQLNGNYVDAKEKDQNLLRGAKAIADKVDWASIMLKATKEDIELLAPILEKGYEQPDIAITVYKNRRSKYKDIILWCKSRRESCRIIPMFVTDTSYELQDIKDVKIKMEPRSAF